MDNPFKQLESTETCPPELRQAIVAEIDLIRNALKVVELYTGDLFATINGLLATSSDNLK